MIKSDAESTRWTDGRSGESGRLVGSLVLDRMDPTGQRIRNFKGTMFNDVDNFWIGRVVGDDDYLSGGVEHWANVSADQYHAMMEKCSKLKRKLHYLFITAHAEQHKVQFWPVPAEAIGRELARRNKNEPGDVLGLHISNKGGRHLLGEEDVSMYAQEFSLAADAAPGLTKALHADRAKGKKTIEPREAGVVPAAVEQFRRFDIPLSAGRSATLHTPVPMTLSDVDRLKNYIGVIADLLIEKCH